MVSQNNMCCVMSSPTVNVSFSEAAIFVGNYFKTLQTMYNEQKYRVKKNYHPRLMAFGHSLDKWLFVACFLKSLFYFLWD